MGREHASVGVERLRSSRFAEFSAPPWDAPLDVTACLAAIPSNATMKGLCLLPMLAEARRRGVVVEGGRANAIFRSRTIRSWSTRGSSWSARTHFSPPCPLGRGCGRSGAPPTVWPARRSSGAWCGPASKTSSEPSMRRSAATRSRCPALAWRSSSKPRDEPECGSTACPTSSTRTTSGCSKPRCERATRTGR